MKLFTKDIDKKLFAQYPKGNNLEEQKVVAKIFNPYGQGRWYLLNSDPEDPDYLWAIVQMGNIVEIGSVSRKELESIRVSPFRFPLERDLGFSPKNAYEVWKGLKEGKFFREGGETAAEENKAMVLNQAEEFEHHAEELEAAAKKADHVPAWVVAKSERASTDLSDITHYLDGENEQKREEMEGEEEYAQGGELKWQDAQLGDSALVVSLNKMGVIIKPYGRKFHLKFVDGTEKTYDASELRFFGDIDDFDRGGQLKIGDEVFEYKKMNTNEPKRKVGGNGKIVSIVDAMAKVSYDNGKHEEFIPLKDLKKSEAGEIKKGDFVMVDNPNWKASMGVDKPVRRKVTMVDDENVFFSDGSNSSLKYVKKMAEGGKVWKRGTTMSFNTKSEANKRLKLMKDDGSYKNIKVEQTSNGWAVTFDFRKELMAEGGKVKFADKVKSIKASLLKRKKVSPKVQKDYGKTYSPAEAEDSAKRIVGAMTAKERLLSKFKKKKSKK